MADTEIHPMSPPVVVAQELEDKMDDVIEPPEQSLEQLPVREIVVGAVGFLVFMTVLVLATNAFGVEQLRQVIEDAGPFAPLVYIGLKAITYIFAPLTSGPIQIIAAPLFGNVWIGTLYTLIGEVLGGSISFWIARKFGRPIVVRLLGKHGTKQVDKLYQKGINNWIVLVAARLILFSIWDFLSYALGLAMSVRFSTYVLISTFVGFIPTLFFVWVGNEAIQDTQSLLLIYGLVLVLVLIPIILRRPIESLFRWLTNGSIARK